MSVLKTKYSGSTLVETIIAMVILVFVFSAGITVYHQAMSSAMNLQKIKAEQLSYVILDDCEKEQTYFDATVAEEGMTAYKRVETVTWGASLYKVSVAVIGPKKDTLYVQKRICYVEP